MIRTIWGDPERFKKSYYPDDFEGKYYLAGDGAIRDEDGYFRIMGRIDDVLNVSGHRLGTMEIESALVANPSWWPRRRWSAGPTTSPARRSAPSSCSSARARPATRRRRSPRSCATGSARRSAPIAKPKDIRFGDNLPKTRSGKIMRRLLRSIAKGEDDHAGRLDAGEPGDPRAAQGIGMTRCAVALA